MMTGYGLPWSHAEVEITFAEELLGTVPKDPAVYASYIASLTKATAEAQAEELTTVPQNAEQIERRGWTGFHTDATGAFVYDYWVMGHLREMALALRHHLQVPGLRSKVEAAVFVTPRRLYLQPGPDHVVERPLRAYTPQGPQVSLVRSDACAPGTRLTFGLDLLDGMEVTWPILATLLDYGSRRGMGQWRSGGWGRYTWRWLTEPAAAASDRPAPPHRAGRRPAGRPRRGVPLPTPESADE
jgi:hypothetical protein